MRISGKTGLWILFNASTRMEGRHQIRLWATWYISYQFKEEMFPLLETEAAQKRRSEIVAVEDADQIKQLAV